MKHIASFDFLSPRITLYQKGHIRHSSIFSGILTIIAYIICFIFVIYSSLELIQHKKPVANFYKRFYDDTGKFLFDSKNMYHFFHFLGMDYNLFSFDSRFIRIKGTRNISNEYAEHWVYDSCDINYDLKDVEDNYFDNSGGACLKYYYNSTEGKYYNIESEKYSPPYLIHGNSNPKNLVYTLYIEICRNDSIENLIYGNNSCATNEEMKTFFSHFVAVYLKLVDHNIDIYDYENPIQNYLNPISSGVMGNTYSQTNINFSPLIIRTKKSIIFDKYKEVSSFIYDNNRRNTNEKDTKIVILSEFTFWMQNVFQIYERSYKDLHEILANVGGIVETIIQIASLINYYYHKYMIKYDSILLFREKEKKIISNTKNFKTNLNLNYDNSNLKKLSNKLSLSSNMILNLNKSDLGDINNHNINLLNMKLQERKKKLEESNIQYNIPKIKYNFDFNFTFFMYILPFKDPNVKNCLNIIEEFRKKLLSEEHLYKSHLDLYFLEQYCNSQNIDKIEINEIYNRL